MIVFSSRLSNDVDNEDRHRDICSTYEIHINIKKVIFSTTPPGLPIYFSAIIFKLLL